MNSFDNEFQVILKTQSVNKIQYNIILKLYLKSHYKLNKTLFFLIIKWKHNDN